jgi:tetratricopeptide (TPR) repeat protein
VPKLTLKELEEAVGADPHNAELRHLLAAEYAQAGCYDAAKAEFFHTLALNPQANVARFQLGLLLLTLGDSGGAIRIWQPLEALGDDASLWYFKHGLEALIRGEMPLCRRILMQGIAKDMTDSPLNADMRLIIERIEQDSLLVRTDFSLYGETRH